MLGREKRRSIWKQRDIKTVSGKQNEIKMCAIRVGRRSEEELESGAGGAVGKKK